MSARVRFVGVVAALVALLAPAAQAQAAESVTLEASSTIVTFGGQVTFSGTIDPAAKDELVEIRSADDLVLATATTDASGEYAVSLEPRANLAVHAVWSSAASEEVRVRVRVVVDVSLGNVRLFDGAVARGSVRPAHPGEAVEVVLIRAGRVVATRRPSMGAAGGFRTVFPIEAPGTYRVRARFSDTDHAPGTAVAVPRTTPLPSLREGSDGPFVRLLERRLVELHYRLVGVNESFDSRTADAVMAFRKVQRMSRTGTVEEAVWRALADPIVPRPYLDRRAFHVEVDQTRQVLYTVEDRVITNIIHVSTGKASTPTRDGLFQVRYKVPGYTPKRLYYASFFDGERAIHGWPDVPPYPASHGCVRVPYWHAKWIFSMTPVGTPVAVHH